MQSFPILHEPVLKILAFFKELEVERLHVTAQFAELFSPQGLSARSSATQFYELDYSTQVMQPKSQISSGYSAHMPQFLEPRAQFDELDYSTKAMQPKSQISSGYSAHRPQRPELSSLV